jgi:hypothetical protein
VRRHGDEAALVASHRADGLLAAGDLEGCAIWKGILEAVAGFTRTKPVVSE